MGKYARQKPKVYKNSKISCACGGFYTSAVYTGCYANMDPQKSHEETKMHQDFINRGKKMDPKVKERLAKAVSAAEQAKQNALAEKRAGQVLCGCG